MTIAQTFVVFTNGGGYQESHAEVGRTVPEIIEWLLEVGYVPIAWREGDLRLMEVISEARIKSIAAGRLIDCIDGVYVARGSMTPTLDKLVAEKPVGASATDIPKTRCPACPEVDQHAYCERDCFKQTGHPADLAMIARDGPARPAKQAVIPPAPKANGPHAPIAGLTRLGVVDHRLGSAFR